MCESGVNKAHLRIYVANIVAVTATEEVIAVCRISPNANSFAANSNRGRAIDCSSERLAPGLTYHTVNVTLNLKFICEMNATKRKDVIVSTPSTQP